MKPNILTGLTLLCLITFSKGALSHVMHCTYELQSGYVNGEVIGYGEEQSDDFAIYSYNGVGLDFSEGEAGYTDGYNDGYSDNVINQRKVFYNGNVFMFPDGYETVNPFATVAGIIHFETEFDEMTIVAKSEDPKELLNISEKMCREYNDSLYDGSSNLFHLSIDCSKEYLKQVCIK